MTHYRRVYNSIILGLLVVIAGCSADEVSQGMDVISSFQTDKGADAVYQIGEEISFSFTLAQAGYVELEIKEPGRDPYVLQYPYERMQAGEHVLPDPASPYLFELNEPTGQHSVTLRYQNESARPSVTDSAIVTFEIVR